MSTGWQGLLIVIGIGLSVASCEDPRANHRPVITSVLATPDSIGPRDSTAIVCAASDPDGDVLVYDWETDARLKIKGNRDNDDNLYNTASNTHVFYPGPVSLTPVDTAWIRCYARDQRGMSAGRTIRVLVTH